VDINYLQKLKEQQRIKAVNFIEAGHSPIVIEVEYLHQGEVVKALLKDEEGIVTAYNHLKEGYDVCLKAGIHSANLIQIETDEEVCRSEYANYHRQLIPLTF